MAGLLAGLIVVTRPGRWARRQGILIIALSAALMSLGIGLAPMVADSHFAGKARSELNAVARETERGDAELRRQTQAEVVKSREELAATEARLSALQARQDKASP